MAIAYRMSDDGDKMVKSSVRIFLADPDEAIRTQVHEMLLELGHEIVGQSDSCHDTLANCLSTSPELILSAVSFPDGDGIDTLVEVSATEPLPAVIIASKANLARVERALDDHVMAYLMEPVSIDDLKPTIHLVFHRFEQFQSLRSEVEGLKEALDTRKKLERAKGILMANDGITEEEAYYQLRNRASRERKKLAAIADQVIEDADSGK